MPQKLKYLVIAYSIGLALLFTFVPWTVSAKASGRKSPVIRNVSYG